MASLCGKKLILLPKSLVRHAHNDGLVKGVRIGCSSGFWGDTPTAAQQLIYGGNIQYLVCDYLSEVTMSLLAAARAKNPQLGFTPDFLESIGPHLGQIKKQGIRIVTNGGGINPKACSAMLQGLAKKAGVELKVAEVTGDDLMPQMGSLVQENIKEMFSGQPFPKKVNSMNAYYGAGPVVKALDMGADIVITGRCTDSALALGPLMHEHKWSPTDFDKLAAGSLAGHLIECGAQCTGGNHTDWSAVPGYDNMGFPIAEVSESGDILISKPPNTGGLINCGNIGEQMLYEIGDPKSYILPDVVADFSQVTMKDLDGQVLVTGAKGRPPTEHYKVSSTYLDGFKATCVVNYIGQGSDGKARTIADSTFLRAKRQFDKHGIKDFEQKYVHVIGGEQSFGKLADVDPKSTREAVLWMSVKHQDKNAINIWAKEIAAAGTGGPPGVTGVIGGRPKATPCLKLFSFLYPKSKVDATITIGDKVESYSADTSIAASFSATEANQEEPIGNLKRGNLTYKLGQLAFLRSGDKGDSCNVGVIARHPALLPYIKEKLTTENMANLFSHVLEDTPNGGEKLVQRYDVPGIHGMNFVLEKSLGGGGIASLRPDPQGKAYAQILAELELKEMPDCQEFLAN